MAIFICEVCEYLFDEGKEAAKWENLPQDWICPVCDSGKSFYHLLEETTATSEISVSEVKSKSLNVIIEAKGKDASAYEWLSWNKEQLQGTFVSIPERLQIPENIKEQLIVELYSK